MSIDVPGAGSAVPEPFTIAGWALDPKATANTGIDTVHVYAFPASGPAIFLGFNNADAFTRRDDVAALFGPQFAMSGYQIFASGLEPGHYTLAVYARSIATGTFDTVRTAAVDVGFSSRPIAVVDAQPGAGTLQPFQISGWSVDYNARYTPLHYGTGIDAVYVQIVNASTNALVAFVPAQYGSPRPDVASALGDSRFTNCGYSAQFRDLAPGNYRWSLYSFDHFTGTWAVAFNNAFSVAPGPMLVIDRPSPGATMTQPFAISGWTADLRATSGTGVDAVHVWAYPSSGASPLFAGAATLNGSRPDVGSIFGSHFTNSGYSLSVTGLPPGGYTLVVWIHSTVTGTFVLNRTVPVVVQ
jgi:hypothetical protein